MYTLRIRPARGRLKIEEGRPEVVEEGGRRRVRVRWLPVGTLSLQAMKSPGVRGRFLDIAREARGAQVLGKVRPYPGRGRRWLELDVEGESVEMSTRFGVALGRLRLCARCGAPYEARPNRKLCDHCGRVFLPARHRRIWERVVDRLRHRVGGRSLLEQARADLVVMPWGEWREKWDRRLRPGRKPTAGRAVPARK